MNDRIGIEFYPGDATKVFLEHRSLDFQLVLIVGVLVMAASTAAKIRAPGLDAMRGWLKNLFGTGARKTGFIFEQLCQHLFTLQHKRHKDSFSRAMFVGRQARQAIASIDQFFDGELQ